MIRLLPALALFFVLLVAAPAFAQSGKDIQLPAVSALAGVDLYDALRGRESLRAFDSKELALQDLGDVLWAANGQKTPGGKWIIPFARRTDPTFRVYVTGKDGTYLYQGSEHKLSYVHNRDLRASVALQDFVAEAPVVLIFVVDPSPLRSKALNQPLEEVLYTIYLSCGASMQDIYLVAAAKHMATCFIGSIKHGDWEDGLVKEGEAYYGCMPLGYAVR